MQLEQLQGQIERITYSNDTDGYTVARIKVAGQKDLVTVVGNLMAPQPGEVLRMTGRWTSHPRFGEQFQVVQYQTLVPATVYGIRKYLGSGLIKGIGPVIAERIVRTFGARALDVIETNAADLSRVAGIGKKRIAMIEKAWADQKEIREVMLFLQSHGVSSGYATKIFKHYGNEAIPVVTENPYRLAMDIWGIGFVTADRIAEKLGFEKEAPVRAQAGILYVLSQLTDDGHVFYPYPELMEKCREVLEVRREILVDAFAAVEAEKKIRIEDLNPDPEQFIPDNKAVYLAQMHVCETSIARRIRILMNRPKTLRPVDLDRAMAWLAGRLTIQLAPMQARAVRSALKSKVMVITGGPGTGKTTIINAFLKIVDRMGAAVLLAAPTGRAAKRMTETTGHPAQTIHRLLKFSPKKGAFEKNQDHPLTCEVLIIDEASMIDTVLMHHLLKAVPGSAVLIMVGDVNQLPSVGPGSVLSDIITSAAVPVVALTEIFRQAQASRIIVNAHRINAGRMIHPHTGGPEEESDFYFIEKTEPEDAVALMVRLITRRIPQRFGLDPMEEIQVLTPMNKGMAGARNLNSVLQEALNPGGQAITRGQRTYRAGDKVIQLRNNYDKEVFNGDIGRIRQIRPEEQEVVIAFDGREIPYDYSELDEVNLAYAISVHKAQGSEYPAVIMPVLIQHYVLLQRNLLYTAVTRGRKLVVLVGTKKAAAIAIRNNSPRKRYTLLRERLTAGEHQP